jgi:DNA replication protein DnaC
MERMNEILARAASRSMSTRRMPSPAQTTTVSASGPRRAVTRRDAPTNLDASKQRGNPAPTRLLSDAATVSPMTPPLADVVDNDRILELPARPKTGIVRTPAVRPASMPSIREIAPAYAARISLSQQPRQAASTRGTADASPTASASGARNPSASAPKHGHNATTPSGANPSPARTGSTQGGRGTRTSAKASAPGVCPLCHGAGYVRLDVPVGDPSFGQAVRCQCKEQQIEERDRTNLRRLSNLDPFRDKTFEAFDTSLPGLREAYDIACHYAEDPMGWLVFRGNYGCGKTHLAAAIANVAEQNGIPVVFGIVPDLLDHLRATFAPNSDTPYDALFDKLREVQLLVLDDFGAENSTAWATEKLFQLINYRYNYRMPTVITTNHRLMAHMDERIRSRLSDLGLVRHVVIEAADYRERHTGRPARGGGRGRPR